MVVLKVIEELIHTLRCLAGLRIQAPESKQGYNKLQLETCYPFTNKIAKTENTGFCIIKTDKLLI